jgi:hypothetical protein
MLSMIVLFSRRRKSTGVETFESMLLLGKPLLVAHPKLSNYKARQSNGFIRLVSPVVGF